MRSKLCSFCLLVLFLAASHTARAEFDARKWEYFKEIKPLYSVNCEYGSISVDKQVYSGAIDFPADLRIVNEQGGEVPYQLRVGTVHTENPTSYNARMLNNSIVAGKYTTCIIDLGKSGLINNQINISTYQPDFMSRVEIAGSQNMNTWAVLKTDGYILNVKDYQRTDVAYPANTYRYLRVKVSYSNGKPVRIQSAKVRYEKAFPAREVVLYEGGPGKVDQNRREPCTDITIDLKSGGLFPERADIESSDLNYHRTVQVFGSADGREWTDMGAYGNILKYDTQTFKGEESSISIPSQSPYRYLRIRIDNQDNPPIRITRVKVYSYKRDVVFPLKNGSTYRLYYGSPVARTSVYDVKDIEKYIPGSAISTMALGPQQHNPEFSLPFWTGPWLQRHPWVLWTVLIATMAVLLFLSMRLAIQTRDATR